MKQADTRYFEQLKETLQTFARQEKNADVFLFGSSIKKDVYGDIDVGIRGRVSEEKVRKLRETFEESTFPFVVDVVNFNTVSSAFADHVFSDSVLWIQKHSK